MLWTAPELLRMPEKLRPLYGTKLGDVYSYGIILQEAIMMDQAFAKELLNDMTPSGIMAIIILLTFYKMPY